jgi:Tol biopolymer transport system component
MDLKTRQVSTLPKSEGLYSPVPSPDGRYIVANRAGPETLRLFDVFARTWSEFSKIPVNCPTWSHDSKYIYLDSYEREPSLSRIRVSDAKLELIMTLKGVRRTGLGSEWSGLTPDDSPLILRDIGSQEIYALDWDAP